MVNLDQTFTVELDNMESMLIQIELTVMAGDHESYRMSVETNKVKYYISVCSWQSTTRLGWQNNWIEPTIWAVFLSSRIVCYPEFLLINKNVNHYLYFYFLEYAKRELQILRLGPYPGPWKVASHYLGQFSIIN